MHQRSPIIFWLLLAATVSVDAVVVSQVADDRYQSTGYLTTTLYALIVSQLSIVCIWSALRMRPTIWTRIAPAGAVALASLAAGSFTPLPLNFRGWVVYWNYLGYFCLHAVALLALLWLLQRTNYWQRRTRVKRTWQFSLAHLLIVMTLTGIVAMLTRNNVFLVKDAATNIPKAFCCVALATASALLWSFSWNSFLRLASVIGVAWLLGVATQVVFFGPRIVGSYDIFTILQIYYLIQAIVLSIWLGVGPILPATNSGDLTVPKQASLVQS